MPVFLSDAWCRAVTGAGADLPPEALAGSPFLLRLEVAGPAAGYQATFGDGRLMLMPLSGRASVRRPDGSRGTDEADGVNQASAARTTGGADRAGETVPTVVLATDGDTAARLAAGSATVADALAAGKVKVRGDVALLSERAAAIAALGVATRRVGPDTTFDGAGTGPAGQ